MRNNKVLPSKSMRLSIGQRSPNDLKKSKDILRILKLGTFSQLDYDMNNGEEGRNRDVSDFRLNNGEHSGSHTPDKS